MKLFSQTLALFFSILMSPSSEAESSVTASSSGSLAFASIPPGNSETEGTSNNAELPQLPESDPEKDIPTIKLGETISFESMGPVIINPDGTTRRINNWDQLTSREKEVTWRRISKRNEERRKILLEQQQKAEEEGDN